MERDAINFEREGGIATIVLNVTHAGLGKIVYFENLPAPPRSF
jgi:hypothetical protein